MLPLAGRVLTLDALYCQRAFCRKVLQGGGNYLVIVKRNQPLLHEAIALAFTQPVPGEKYGYVQQEDRHGDRQSFSRRTTVVDHQRPQWVSRLAWRAAGVQD